ncbi:MAG: UDP-N-acetylmuramate dehydrogenase [Eubacterium sp.]|nr:UDP-N-acetylmuramate dehydrogenase [Eubacterium sp.]
MSDFLQKLSEGIHKGTVLCQEPMSRHTTFCVGGPADYFVSPGSQEEAAFAVRCAREEQVPFFVVGKGSNLLVSDRGYRGMILQIGKNLQDVRTDGTVITADAGATLAMVARSALNSCLTGLEFAAGIPGTVGGGVSMNAGAYNGEIKDVLIDTDVLTTEGRVETIKAEDMELSYRRSCVFDRGYIVLSARFGLERGDREQILARMEELASARKSKQPLEYPSAGSTFKRPEGYFAGKLIQDAGLKGYTVGGAQVSEKHSGFVINKGGATASEIAFLIRRVQEQVKKAYGVTMHPEVRFVGFDESEVTR